MEIINANPFGALSQNRLEEFEKQIQSRLPQDYRDFLLQYNGGQPAPSFFWIVPEEDGSEVERFYGIHDQTWHSLETYVGEQRYGIPSSLLPIADDGTSNFVCIDISTDHYGEVYFIDHELHEFDPGSTEGITKLANAFSEFLRLLDNAPD